MNEPISVTLELSDRFLFPEETYTGTIHSDGMLTVNHWYGRNQHGTFRSVGGFAFAAQERGILTRVAVAK